MYYELGFQHPDTGVFVIAKWAFGRITISLDDDETHRPCDCGADGPLADHDPSCGFRVATEAYRETKDKTDPYHCRPCRSLSEADRIGLEMASDQFDYGWERID